MLEKIAVAATAATLFTFSVAEAVQAASFTVLASGLDNPRKLAFGPDGALYVTEAGRGGSGPCLTSAEGVSCYGTTNAVTRIQNGVAERVLTGLPSTAFLNGDSGSGATDIAFDNAGNPFILLSWIGTPEQRASDSRFSPFGTLVRVDNLNSNPTFSTIADLEAFEVAQNPDGGEILSNPFSLLIEDNTAFLTDAAGNDALRVETNGSNLAVQSVFPPRFVPSPFGGPAFSMQSVPTSIARGPDGAIYVGELTGFPFPQGQARVYRINSNTNQPEVFATGFTNIIDIDFDLFGNLYVLQYAANSLLSPDRTCALLQVSPTGERQTLIMDGLIAPTGLAIDSNGNIYVSNNGLKAGLGQVIRISQVPEPSAALGLLAFGALGATSALLRQQNQHKSATKGIFF